MDGDGLYRFIDRLKALFMNGELNEAAEHVVFPLVVYTAVGVVVLRDGEQATSMFRQYRNAVVSLGITEVTFTIEEREEPQNERMRVLVQFTNHQQDGTVVSGSRVRYFLVTSGDAYKVEMMEYLNSLLSPSQVDRIIH